MIAQPMRAGDETSASCFDDWQYALAKGSKLNGSSFGIGVGLQIIFEIRLREDVSRVWKYGNPAAIPKLRVPANMIVMQVRAHDQVDLVWSRSRCGEPLKKRRVEHIPERARRPRFVVAAARVDQDLLVVDLQQPTVHAQFDEAGR